MEFSETKRDVRKRGTDFLTGPVLVGQGVMVLSCKRVGLN